MSIVASVRFRSGSKSYYFDPRDLQVEAGQDVIVETAQGVEFGQCTEGNHEVADDSVVKPLRPIIRIATDNDRHTAAYHRGREKEIFEICQKKIQQHKLEMKLVRVECSFDGSKILFFFTADGRVDFRELVKDLAGVFRSRIELRQIGVRDEAKMLGGLGMCGRPFCCSSYLDEFVPVSIKMAKTQSLSLNPTKISGTCGRLMCCLKYEQDAYEDALRRMPKAESFVLTPDGPGNVSDVNLLKETVTVRLDDKNEQPRTYRNCEVQVLRNGKGSRDGIEIPTKRPERYVEPVESAEPIIPSILEETAAAEEEVVREERSRRRRSRGGRRNKNKAAGETVAVAAEEQPKAEKAEQGEKTTSRRRRRGGSRPKTENAAAAETKPKEAAPAPKAEKSEGGSAHRRPRHRGGRRHNKNKSSSANNGGEA
ncbi:MAG: stage 0 sporulation family protein [Oscillospiraceae bacterium]|nr:stage 0 sporulation family protein [Oscillospiraceae bacterium]